MSRIPDSTTRIVVVTESGAQEFWADSWDVHVQDGGATVKLFARGPGANAQEQRRRSLSRYFRR